MTFKHTYLFIVFYLIFNSTQANALVILQQASVLTSVEYDTNPTLVSRNEQSIFRYTASPKYTLTGVDGNNRWYTNVGINFQRSSNQSVSGNRKDPIINIGWEREYERGRYSIITAYNKSSSRFSELNTTGIVDKDGTITSKSIAVAWSRLLNERLDLSVNGQYAKSNVTKSSFSNTTTKTLGAVLTYELSEKIRPFIQANLSELSSGNGSSTSTISQNYLLGTNLEVNPLLSLSGSLGLNHQQNAGNGWVANTSASYLGERYNFHGALSRNVVPSGTGQFQKNDNLSLVYGYSLSDTSKTGVDLSWNSNDSINGSETRQLGGWYSKVLSDLWQFRLALSLKELKNSNQSASAGIFGITFTYNTPEF